MNKNRRKNYFIKKKFQASFFIKFALLLFAESILIAILFMYITRGTLTTAYHGTGLTIQKTTSYFSFEFFLITTFVGLAMATAGVIVFMFLTHRLGGPLYRFEQSLKEAGSGNLSRRMTLRGTDQLVDLKDELNAFLEDADSRISDIKSDVDKAVEISGKDGGEIKEILGKIKLSLGYFKTTK